jgi:hypothetical protein
MAFRSVAPLWQVIVFDSAAAVGHPSAVSQAILDTSHSGTLLDLPHYNCNNIYVPWLSKGERRTKSYQNNIGRTHHLYYAIPH